MLALWMGASGWSLSSSNCKRVLSICSRPPALVCPTCRSNITRALNSTAVGKQSVVVLSNDNGGMSGTYGMGCCQCGTSCGGLNYPYRGWKDSYCAL